MGQLFASNGQSIEASASALPVNIQGRFPLGLTGFISLLSKTLSTVFSNTTVLKHQFFGAQPFFMVQLLPLYMTIGKIIVQFSRSVLPDSLWPHGLQHMKLPCASPNPKACLNSCPLSQWCWPTISFSVIPISSCLQSFPESGAFPVSQFFASDGQSIGASASALPVNIQDWFPLGLTGWICLGLSRICSSTTVQKHQFFSLSLLYSPALTSIHMTTGKTTALTRWTFVGKVMPLLFNILPRLAIAFLPRS